MAVLKNIATEHNDVGIFSVNLRYHIHKQLFVGRWHKMEIANKGDTQLFSICDFINSDFGIDDIGIAIVDITDNRHCA